MNKSRKLIQIKSRGASMAPLIRERDLVYVEKTKKNKRYYSGDIVVFPFRGRLLCHRILLINNRMAITKGDNSWRGEVVKPLKKIIGKVAGVKRNGKYIDFQSHTIRILYILLFCYSFATMCLVEGLYVSKKLIFRFKYIMKKFN